MPTMTEYDFNKLVDEIFEHGIPLSLRRTKEDENEAKKNANEYLKTNKLKKKTPLTMYHIIRNLEENKRIPFIKEHIEFIKENDESIFLYTMLSPSSLSYYLTFQNIKDLYHLDKELFTKVINQNHENLFHGFSHEEYIEFYKTYKKEMNDIKNIHFINSLYHHSRCCYDNMTQGNVNDRYTLQQTYNIEFINMILEEYKNKIDSFDGKELKDFLSYIRDINLFESIIKQYKDKLTLSFEEIDTKELSYYLSEQSDIKQEILFKYFKDVIVTKENIKQVIPKISTSIIFELFNNKKDLFEEFTLKDWIQLASKKRQLSQEFKDILDTYKIENIEELFDTKFYLKAFYRESTESLKYIEQKYRKNISSKILNPITEKTSIFSKEYFENLHYLKINNVAKNEDIYKKHFILFLEFIKIHNIELTLNNIKEIELLFKRIIGGCPMSLMFDIKSIEEIALINRIGDIEFDPKDFNVEQLKNYNVKNHKKLNGYIDSSLHKSLTLKLMLMVGFNNAKKILEHNNKISVIEHLVGNVDVKNIKINNQGEPILNKRIINMLFNDNKVIEMLDNKNSDLYKFFPRIFNEWEMIKINGKDKNLNTIIEFLKSDEISLPPKYHRLEGLFKYIGCNNSIVEETLKLHNEMLERKTSTIPRITGQKDDYTYEILKYDDMLSLAVGNITDCCFTVLGVGYQCLRHALTSQNGRIFVIKKDNEIIAHSWLWRNGNHICFDNIETSKKTNKIDFLNIYVEASKKLIEETYKYEKENCIKNVTIGYTNFDKRIEGIENYPYLMSETCEQEKYKGRLSDKKIITEFMPKPLEEVNYSDSKNVQFVITTNNDIKSYQSSYLYQDEREETLSYDNNEEYNSEYISKIMKIINSLRYIKFELENKLDKFEILHIFDIEKIFCNDDWYIIEYKDGFIEEFNISQDVRSNVEIEQVIKSKKILIK